MKLLNKKWISKRNCAMRDRVVSRGLCVGLTSERRDRLKASVLVKGGHFER